MAVKCIACGTDGGLHTPGCLANAPAHIVGQQSPYVGQDSGWVCDRCEYKAPVVMTEKGPGVNFSAVTQLAGEETPLPHCNECYIRMIREHCGVMVMQKVEEARDNGSGL